MLARVVLSLGAVAGAGAGAAAGAAPNAAQQGGGYADYQQYLKQGGSGGYQKYMQQGGDYQKNMKQYTGGAQPTSLLATAEKEEASKGHTSSHKQGSSGDAPVSASQVGDFKQYMAQFGGDDQKLMQQFADYTKNVKMGGAADFKQFMRQAHAGMKEGTDAMSGGFSQFMKQAHAGMAQGKEMMSVDYQTYMKQLSDYQAYLKQGGTADYAQFMKAYQPTGGMSNYARLMKQAQASQPTTLLAKGSSHSSERASHASKDATDYTQYIDGFFDFQDKMPKQMSPMGWSQDASAYQKWINSKVSDAQDAMKSTSSGPQTADDCKTVAELRKWKAGQEKLIHAFVPASARGTARSGLQAVYEQHEARIEREEKATAHGHAHAEAKVDDNATAPSPKATALVAGPGSVDKFASPFMPHFAPDAKSASQRGAVPDVKDPKNPVDWARALMKNNAPAYEHFVNHDAKGAMQTVKDAPQSVDDCHNMKDLEKWRQGQHGLIDNFVPKGNQGSAFDGLKATYEQNKARIEREEVQAKRKAAEERRKAEAAKKELSAETSAAANASNLLAADDSLKDDLKRYASKYAGDYVGANADSALNEADQAPAAAADCRSVKELKAWRDGQRAQIKVFVPKGDRSAAEASLQAEFKRHEKRVEHEEEAARKAEAVEAKAREAERETEAEEAKAEKAAAAKDEQKAAPAKKAAPTTLAAELAHFPVPFFVVMGASFSAVLLLLSGARRERSEPDVYLKIGDGP